VASGARVGSPRRSTPISIEKRDGSDQFVLWADSGKQGSPARARAPPRRRFAGPCCSNAINTIFIGPQLSLTASESERAAWHSLAGGTKAESDAGATAIGRCGSHVYRVSVSSRWMPADESLMTTRGRREWGAGFSTMCLSLRPSRLASLFRPQFPSLSDALASRRNVGWLSQAYRSTSLPPPLHPLPLRAAASHLRDWRCAKRPPIVQAT